MKRQDIDKIDAQKSGFFPFVQFLRIYQGGKFWSEIFLGPKKFMVQKILDPKKCWVPKNFGSEKKFWVCKNLR